MRLLQIISAVMFIFVLSNNTFAAERRGTSTGPSFICDPSSGITVGGGIEHSISPDWTIRGEYRFTDLDTGSGTDAFGNTFSLDGDMHIGRIGIARRLGRSEPSAEALK